MLTDGGVRIRPVRLPDDVSAALPWYHDPEVLYDSEGPGTPPYDAETVRQMYEIMNRYGEGYIIEVEAGGGRKPVGDCALHPDTLTIVIGDANYTVRGESDAGCWTS